MEALVTGATSGIGYALSRYLIQKGYTVYMVGRDFSKVAHQEGMVPIVCDLRNNKELIDALLPLAKKPFDIVINSAGFGQFMPHENQSPQSIIDMTQVNLTASMLVGNIFTQTLKNTQGILINISSIEAVRSSKFSAVYSATKSGLRSYSLALFEEVRKSGMKVVVLTIDMTQTPFFDALNFKPSHKEGAHLDVENIVQAVDGILNMPKNSATTEITIRPQLVAIEKK